MRTTVTLDPDVEQVVRREMAQRGVSFKRALNDVIRRGAAANDSAPFRTQTAAMGQSTVDLDRALALAGALEDEALLRRMSMGS